MAKRFVVIGLGIFGEGIASELYELGHEVLVLDMREDRVNRIAKFVTTAAVGDARQPDVLERIGAKDVDGAIVSTGDDISASILIAMLLSDIGVPNVYVKVVSTDHERILRKIGIKETVFPEYESAVNLAQRITHGDSLLNYVRLADDFSMQEMAVPAAWNGKTLRELELRPTYGVSVIAVRDVLTDRLNPVPDPDAPLKDSDTLLMAGAEDNLDQIADIE